MALSESGSPGWIPVEGQRVYRSVGDASEDILVRGARDIGAKLSRGHFSMEGEQISTKPRDMGGGHGSPRNDILSASVVGGGSRVALYRAVYRGVVLTRALTPPTQALRMLVPGAKTLMLAPMFEKGDMASKEVDAPTTQAPAAEEGEKLLTSAFPLPAATVKNTPLSTRASTALLTAVDLLPVMDRLATIPFGQERFPMSVGTKLRPAIMTELDRWRAKVG